MSHLDEGTLHALLDGEIPSDELAPMLAHLSGCADCRALLEEARTLAGEALGLVESLGDGVPPAEAVPSVIPPVVIPLRKRNRAPLYRGLALAATAVLAAGLGYWARDQRVLETIAVNGKTYPVLRAAEAVAESAGAMPGALQNSATPPAPRTAPTPTAAPERRRGNAADGPPAVADRDAESAGARTLGQAGATRAEEAPRQQDAEATKVAAESLRRLQAIGAAAPAANLQAMPAAPRRLSAAEERSDVLVESFTPIDFTDAIARLGGTLRLVDGLVPDRLEASTVTVRVIYPLQTGELVLEQRRMGDSVAVVLRGPLSEDSLAILRRKVR